MKPSEILVFDVLPFPGTFGSVEAELMAALYVKTCVRRGDMWAPQDLESLRDTVRQGVYTDRFVRELVENPFLRLDIQRLVEETDAAHLVEGVLTFTEAGFERLRRWYRPQAGWDNSPRPVNIDANGAPV